MPDDNKRDLDLMQRTFEMRDQEAFADWSGDRNPIHMSALAARRTQAGRPLVHGVHTLLWMLDSVCSSEAPPRGRMRVQFPSPVYLGDVVEVRSTRRADGALQVQASVDGAVVVSVKLSDTPAEDLPVLAKVEPGPPDWPASPLDLDLDQAVDQHGAVQFAALADHVGQAFPNLSRQIGTTPVAGLACLSRIVGMISPGLHSILSEIDVTFTGSASESVAYATTAVDGRFRTVDLAVDGGGLCGTVQAFGRTPPVRQPTTGELAQSIHPDAFAGEIALVVGGSRGLGEVVAKQLAAGGAEVMLTYHSGRQDAEAVERDIVGAGFKAGAVHMDMSADVDARVKALPATPTHVYYFATGPIFGRRTKVYDPNVFDGFRRFYVDGFADLIAAVRDRSGGAALHVFYPSSVAVEERPKDMTEYAMAKAAGEILCHDLDRGLPGLKITVERLPRILTDQTATIRAAKSESAAEAALRIVRRMHPA